MTGKDVVTMKASTSAISFGVSDLRQRIRVVADDPTIFRLNAKSSLCRGYPADTAEEDGLPYVQLRGWILHENLWENNSRGPNRLPNHRVHLVPVEPGI